MDAGANVDGRLRQVLLLVKNEASSVITEMRKNTKWASRKGISLLCHNRGATVQSPDVSDGSRSLLDALLALRLDHRVWADEDLQPLTFLRPFLDIITSAEASGPITAAALMAVHRLLSLNVLGLLPPSGTSAAMHETVAALTMCKFEATNPAHDQMVLCKILQTLHTCLACPAGHLLSDSDVCSIFQAVYRIGFDAHVMAELSEIVVDLVKDTLTGMVRIVFASLDPDAASRPSSAAPAAASDATAEPPVQAAGANGSSAGCAPEAVGTPAPAEDPSYGVGCAVNIFRFLLKLVKEEPMNEFGLELLREAIHAAGPRLERLPELLPLIQVDMLVSLLEVFKEAQAAESPSTRIAPEVVTLMSQVMLTMYLHLRACCMLQVEVFIQAVLLPLAAGKLLQSGRGHTPSALSEAALDALLDFCLLPGFLREAYACLDCRVECSNLFSDVVAVLGRRAQPRPSARGLQTVNVLALRCLLAVLHGLAAADAQPQSVLVPPESLYAQRTYVDVWQAIVAGDDPPCELVEQPAAAEGADMWADVCAARRMQWEKVLKGKLAASVQLFNEDYKKGLQSLQVNRLLPDPMDGASVAALLRFARGVDRQTIGNFMGKGADFNQEVLAAYVRTLPLRALSFDGAFRAFADTFKQPPESQQVVRFTKNFVLAFLEAHNNDWRGFRTVKCLDDFMTVCLWHNSTWYNANPKVPKMNTLKQFRDSLAESISEHDDPEDAVFEELYTSICSCAFPQGTDDPFRVDMPAARLALIAQRSATPRGRVPPTPDALCLLDRDMFLLMWSTTARAVSQMLEQASPDDAATADEAMHTLHTAAAIAKANYVPDVVDHILLLLLKYSLGTSDTPAPYPLGAIALGSSPLACTCLTNLFAIASEFADLLRSGWATLLAALMRLHRLHLVDAAVFADDSPDGVPALRRARAAAAASADSSSNLFGFFFTAAPDADAQLSPSEAAAEEEARRAVAACRPAAIFDDSKFLGPDALQALARAVTAAAPATGTSAEPADLDAAEAALELLIKLAIRNRDRIHVLLPQLNAHVAAIVEAASPATEQLTQRAAVGVLRVAARLLTYRSDVVDSLVDSLKILLDLDMSDELEQHVWALAPHVAHGVNALLQACAARIESQPAWVVILALLRGTAGHPDAVPFVFSALQHLTRDGGHLCPANFMHCTSALADAIEKAANMLHPHTPRGTKFSCKDVRAAVDLLEAMVQWLCGWRQRQAQSAVLPGDGGEGGDMHARKWYAALVSYWHHLLGAIVGACVNWNHEVRNHAVVVLHRSLTTAGENLHLTPDTWGTTWRELLLPLIQSLASEGAADADGDAAPPSHTLCLAINVVHKTFIAHFADLMSLRDWRGLWLCTLQALAACTALGKADVQAAAVEAVAGLLQTMHARKMLTAASRDAEAASMWERTWKTASGISAELTPERLGCV